MLLTVFDKRWTPFEVFYFPSSFECANYTYFILNKIHWFDVHGIFLNCRNVEPNIDNPFRGLSWNLSCQEEGKGWRNQLEKWSDMCRGILPSGGLWQAQASIWQLVFLYLNINYIVFPKSIFSRIEKERKPGGLTIKGFSYLPSNMDAKSKNGQSPKSSSLLNLLSPRLDLDLCKGYP